MKRSLINKVCFAPILIWLVISLACNLPARSNAEQITIPVTGGNNNPVQNTPIPQEIIASETISVAATATETPIPPTDTATATATVVHLVKPSQPGGFISWMFDTNSSTTSAQKRAPGGDDFSRNLYERPFNANTMDRYYTDVDIQKAYLSLDSTWVYVAITLNGPDTESNKLDATYMVEVDVNNDGRGDFLITAASPAADWSTDRVQVWSDANHDVGNAVPIMSDPPQKGDGYETKLFDQGAGSDPDTAWARISPQAPNVVWIAFKFSVINQDGQFMWGAWADRGLNQPGWFDYNDHFTQADAGSPLSELTTYYPIKAIFAVDNTCRWAVGFTPKGNEPGICPIAATATPQPPPTKTPKPFTKTPKKPTITKTQVIF